MIHAAAADQPRLDNDHLKRITSVKVLRYKTQLLFTAAAALFVYLFIYVGVASFPGYGEKLGGAGQDITHYSITQSLSFP